MTRVPPTATPVAVPARAPKTCGLAIASLICGIAGLCTFGLGGLVGLILGIVGIVKVGKSAGRLKGKGLAIGGIVASVICVPLGIFLGIIVLFSGLFMAGAGLAPAVMQARAMAEGVQSMNNVKQLCTAVMMYATANNNKYPPADTWPEALKKDGMISDDVLKDPADKEAGRAYAINAKVADQSMSSLRQPFQTVLFFEAKFGSPSSGGRDLLPDQPRYPGGYVIGFCDGHVERVTREKVDSLIWDPRNE